MAERIEITEKLDELADSKGIRTSKAQILREAESHGYSTSGVSAGAITSFVGCVVMKLFHEPLPRAITECGEKYLKPDG